MRSPDELFYKILFSEIKEERLYPLNDTRANVDEVIVGNHHVSVLVNRVTLA